MKRVSLDAQDESVKRFVLSLSADPGGSILELDGRAVAHVLPIAPEENGSQPADGTWTEAKNARRCALIDQEIAGALRPEEAAELYRLQQEMLHHRRRVAPLPIEDVRQLYQGLLARAQAARRGGRP